MHIEELIKRIYIGDNWLRLDQLGRIPQGLEFSLGVYAGRRGKKLEQWCICCLGVRESSIGDLDGFGLAIYPSSHPAARQYFSRDARLQWTGIDPNLALGALCKANADAADDWIPLDYYTIDATSRGEASMRGPDFLMKAYASALRALGARVQLVLLKTKKETGRPRVLHFGSSYVVADRFDVRRES